MLGRNIKTYQKRKLAQLSRLTCAGIFNLEDNKYNLRYKYELKNHECESKKTPLAGSIIGFESHYFDNIAFNSYDQQEKAPDLTQLRSDMEMSALKA